MCENICRKQNYNRVITQENWRRSNREVYNKLTKSTKLQKVQKTQNKKPILNQNLKPICQHTNTTAKRIWKLRDRKIPKE